MRRLRFLVPVLAVALLAWPTLAASAEDPPPATVTITSAQTTYVAGVNALVRISVRDANNAEFRLGANLNGQTIWLGCGGFVVTDDDFDCEVYMVYNTRLFVTLDGVTKAVRDLRVRPRIGTAVKTSHSTVGRYAVMPRGTAPRFTSKSYPARPGQMCLRHEVQRLRSGVWRTVVLSGCRVEGDKGTVTWTWQGGHPRLVSFRVRATFPGDPIVGTFPGGSHNVAGPGRWTYFRFR